MKAILQETCGSLTCNQDRMQSIDSIRTPAQRRRMLSGYRILDPPDANGKPSRGPH